MTISYPLAIADFQDIIKVKNITFVPSYGQETSGLAGSLILAVDLRPPLWFVQITTRPFSIAESNAIQATLESLEGSSNSFYLYNPYSKVPAGGSFSDTGVKINSIGSDGKSISLKGLPASTVITKGDMLCYEYGSRPYIALHRVLETVTANGSGVTAEFAINGGPRSEAAVNDVVHMNPAYGEFIMPPNGWSADDSAAPGLFVSYKIQAKQFG